MAAARVRLTLLLWSQCNPQAAPPHDLPRLRQLLEHGRLLSLIDQLLLYEQDGDREDLPVWQACMAALSFAGLARLVSPTQLCWAAAAGRRGQVRGGGGRGGGRAAHMHRMLCFPRSLRTDTCPLLAAGAPGKHLEQQRHLLPGLVAVLRSWPAGGGAACSPSS